jgi:hypothetical protein
MKKWDRANLGLRIRFQSAPHYHQVLAHLRFRPEFGLAQHHHQILSDLAFNPGDAANHHHIRSRFVLAQQQIAADGNARLRPAPMRTRTRPFPPHNGRCPCGRLIGRFLDHRGLRRVLGRGTLESLRGFLRKPATQTPQKKQTTEQVSYARRAHDGWVRSDQTRR